MYQESMVVGVVLTVFPLKLVIVAEASVVLLAVKHKRAMGHPVHMVSQIVETKIATLEGFWTL